MTSDVRTGCGPEAVRISWSIGGDCAELQHRSGARATTIAVSIFLLVLPAVLGSVVNRDGGRAQSVQGAHGGIESTFSAGGAEPTAISGIAVHRVRIVAAPPADKERSALVLFTLSNNSSATVDDIVIEVSIVARGASDQPEKPTVLAGPFHVKGSFLFEPGHVTDYEVGLRNLSPGCSCRARVGVISARIVEQP
jgi:hypothetical protein